MPKSRQNEAVRQLSTEIVAERKRREDYHRNVKKGATKLWRLLGNPAYGAPDVPESIFPADAIIMGKGGKGVPRKVELWGVTIIAALFATLKGRQEERR